ncbi:MAG: helix-turn-helix transcriptional regulator [Candidatus Scatosoma sp.]
MNTYFSSKFIVTTIYYSLHGYTKAGKYSYKNNNCYELGFLANGESVSFAQGKTFNIAKNCVVFKPNELENRCHIENGTEFYSVKFNLLNSPKYDFQVFKPQDPEKVLDCFKRLVKEEQKYGITPKSYSLLYEILYLLNVSEKYLSHSSHTVLEDATDFIKQNFRDSEFSISDVTAHLNISASLLRSLFQKKYKKSPIQYLIDKRISYAKKLLLYSEYSVLEISELCGFSSPFYFSRIFKKYTNLSPLTYRKENNSF